MQTGKVKFFNEQKGYGFIERTGGEDIYVHATSIRTRPAVLKPGDEVAFNEETGPRGARAKDVRVMAFSGAETKAHIPSRD